MIDNPSSLSEVDLSVRVENGLKKLYGAVQIEKWREAPDTTLQQLVYDARFNPEKLLSVPQFGQKALEEVREATRHVDHTNLMGPQT